MPVDPNPSPPSPPLTPLPVRQASGMPSLSGRGESGTAGFTVNSKGGANDGNLSGSPHRKLALPQRPGPNGSRVLKKRPSIPHLGDLSNVKLRIWGPDAIITGSSSPSSPDPIQKSPSVIPTALRQSITPPTSLRSRLQLPESADENSSITSSLASQNSRCLNGLSTPESSPPTPTPAKFSPVSGRKVPGVKHQSPGAQPKDSSYPSQIEGSHTGSDHSENVVDGVARSIDDQFKVTEESRNSNSELSSHHGQPSIDKVLNSGAQLAIHPPSMFPAAEDFLKQVDPDFKRSSASFLSPAHHCIIKPTETEMIERPLLWSSIYPRPQSKKKHSSRQIKWPLLQEALKLVGDTSSSQLSKNHLGDTVGATQSSVPSFDQARFDLEVTTSHPPDSKHQLLRQKLLLRGMLGPCGLSGDKEVHVFVDMSNIFIGFQDLAKIKQGKKKSDRVRHMPFAFEQLALILERERRVVKRKLAGSVRYAEQKSYPPLHFEKARTCGYKPDIFVQVPKCDTPRHVHTAKARMLNGTITVQTPYWTSTSGDEDGSEGFDSLPHAQPRERLGEQGVDEHLHHEMSLSVYRDAEEPGIMVLATGDAQPAEYSDGFAQYAIQALEKGWYVEVVSWKHCLSSEWKRSPFRDTYAHRFRIIELDDFHNDLLGDWA